MWTTVSRGSRTSLLSVASVLRPPRSNILTKTMAPAAARKQSTLPPGYVEDLSKGCMLRFQDSVPKLPVPTLEQTAERYLRTLQPLCTPTEFARSKKLVSEFIAPGAVGEELQKRLLAKANDPNVKNWMLDWWNFTAYLGYRDPVVPYVSYFYSHVDDINRRDPVKRAAAITTAALAFKKMVDGKSLEPEYMKNIPLCMDSYKYMFNCCRIPEKPADYPQKYESSENKHIIVMRKNNFFKVMHEVNGQQLSAAELEAQFRRVYELGQERGPAIGALTSENRDIWTNARKMLSDSSPENLKALQTIEAASFLVCFDDAAPVTLEERAHQYWHGDGQNRFYDKPLQFIINDNGAAGFMGEHSMMDGTPTHRLNDYVNHVIFQNKVDYGDPSVRSGLPEPLTIRFIVNSELDNVITAAVKHFKDLIAQHELKVCRYQGYGKQLIKKFKLSPDAYVQMIMQLAYYKMYGKNRPTYESAMTRKYKQGRTETCRTVAKESATWCKAMQDLSVDAQTRIKLLREAVAQHVSYMAAAVDGYGVDRHFFGLRNCLKPGEKIPAVFTDPPFKYSSTWFLSTSQLSSKYYNGYGWSQVVDDGYGIAYMINNSEINFNIVSKKLGCDKLSFYLIQAADEMRELMETELAEAATVVKAKL